MKGMDYKTFSGNQKDQQHDRFGFLRKNVKGSQSSQRYQNQHSGFANSSDMSNRFSMLNLNHNVNHHAFQHQQNNFPMFQHNVNQHNQAPAPPTVSAAQQQENVQEAKPGNKRAILVDLPGYLYSIPSLASFFEPYGEVAMLQILPQKRMWDGDLIDLLGASMCSRLARKSLCAIVEFHSARMAKFIIGILRKRLPTLKFRCALLKPSAAIELTNQADSLGLVNAVRVKTKSTTASSSSETGNNSMSTNSSLVDGSGSDHQPKSTCGHSHSDHSQSVSELSGEESGLEEMSSHTSNNINKENNNQKQAADNSSAGSVHTFSDSDDSVTSTNNTDDKRFVSSFKIVLN